MPRESRLDLLQFKLDETQALDTLTDGSIRVPAIIARTGVQVYQYDDGTEVREYRPPEEVFSPDSLATWRGLSLTIGHPSIPVDPSNWGNLTVGHVGDSVGANVKDKSPEGHRYLTADCVVKDAQAIELIAKGELVELSCGYFADVDRTPGITPEGEAYDQIQRAIVGNHVALGPRGWGRAGSEVRLLIGDAEGQTRGKRAVAYPQGMAIASDKKTTSKTNKGIRRDADNAPGNDPEDKSKTDGKCPSCGADVPDGAAKCDACGATLQGDSPASPETPEAPQTVSMEEFQRVSAERDALAAQLEALTAQLGLATKTEDSRVAKRVDFWVKALKSDSALKLFDDKGNLRSDHDVMMEVIRKGDPKFDGTGKSKDYLRARFDFALEARTDSRPNAEALGNALGDPGNTLREDGTEDPIEAARAKRQAELKAKAATYPVKNKAK